VTEYDKGGERTLRSGEVDDVAVGLEHVDLLDGLDGLGVELLQVGLELLVIVVGTGGRALNRSSGGSLSTARRNTSVDQFVIGSGWFASILSNFEA
jgi:hypothetical protein